MAAQQEYGITGFPAVVFLGAEGDFISLQPGYRPPEEFIGLMESTLKEETAFKQLKEAVQKNPEDPKTNAELALIYIKRGKLETGKSLFDKVVKHDPNNKTGLLPALYVNLGLHYGQNAAGENEKEYFQEAEQYFQIVLDKYSDSESYESALYYLGITYAIQQKSELAIATLEKLNDAKDDEIRQQAAFMLERVKNLME